MPSSKFLITSLSLAHVALALNITPAFAGFEWVPPKPTPQVRTAPPTPAPLTPIQNIPLENTNAPTLLSPQSPTVIQPPYGTDIYQADQSYKDFEDRAQNKETKTSIMGSVTKRFADPDRSSFERSWRKGAIDKTTPFERPEPVVEAYVPPPQETIIKREDSIPPTMSEMLPLPDFTKPLTVTVPPMVNVQTGAPIAEPIAQSQSYTSPQSYQPPPEVAMQAKQPESQYDVVDGFGSDLPLALALRQVVPPSYSFAFDSSVNAGARVSWNGGKPWDLIVSEMVRPLGVESRIVGNAVSLKRNPDMPIMPVNSASANMTPTPVVNTPPINNVQRNVVSDPGQMDITMSASQATPDMLPMPDLSVSKQPSVPTPIASPAVSGMPVSVPSPTMDTTMQDNIINAPQPITNLPTAAAPVAIPMQQAPTSSNTSNVNNAGGNYQRPGRRPSMAMQMDKQMRASNMDMRMQGANYDSRIPQGNMVAPIAPLAQPQPLVVQSPSQMAVRANPSSSFSLPSSPERAAEFSNDTMMGNKVSQGTARTWEASRGDSLKQTFLDWSRQEGINMVWNANQDYQLTSNIFITDTFQNAIKAIYNEALAEGSKPPVRFIDDPTNAKSTTFIVGQGS